MKLALALMFVPGVALADTPLSGAEFDARTLGRTMTYARDGDVWGREMYLKDRKVIWAFTESECREGYWYPQDEQICFVYEDSPGEHCWQFGQGAGGLSARSMTDMPGAELSEVQQTSDGLQCPGPDVGV